MFFYFVEKCSHVGHFNVYLYFFLFSLEIEKKRRGKKQHSYSQRLAKDSRMFKITWYQGDIHGDINLDCCLKQYINSLQPLLSFLYISWANRKLSKYPESKCLKLIHDPVNVILLTFIYLIPTSELHGTGTYSLCPSRTYRMTDLNGTQTNQSLNSDLRFVLIWIISHLIYERSYTILLNIMVFVEQFRDIRKFYSKFPMKFMCRLITFVLFLLLFVVFFFLSPILDTFKSKRNCHKKCWTHIVEHMVFVWVLFVFFFSILMHVVTFGTSMTANLYFNVTLTRFYCSSMSTMFSF